MREKEKGGEKLQESFGAESALCSRSFSHRKKIFPLSSFNAAACGFSAFGNCCKTIFPLNLSQLKCSTYWIQGVIRYILQITNR